MNNNLRGTPTRQVELPQTTGDIVRAAMESRARSRTETFATAKKSDKSEKKWWQKRPAFNFITIHYMYIVGLTILGSLVLFAGGMPYIDAIFFAGGASTQSGLNTIDLNQLYTYQQVVLMLWACISTPIFINTTVVFVRLYWFQKRFKHLVERARENQRTWAKSRSKSEAVADPDPGRVEKGVGGRAITVLHHTTVPNGMNGHNVNGPGEAYELKDVTTTVNSTHSDSTDTEGPDATNESKISTARPAIEPGTVKSAEENPISPLHTRAITFPDELASPHDISPGHPEDPLTVVQHIKIVQRQQQDAKARGGTLRIPGPRDFDRGELPEEIASPLSTVRRRGTADSGEINHMSRMLTQNSEQGQFNADDHPVRRGITINEPANRPRRSETVTTLDHAELKPIKSGLLRMISPLIPHHRTSHDHDNRSFLSRTVTNISNTFSGRDAESAPYLSYAATIGRNSAFVGLTEEQREELGGIEYRSLKLLAKILICYFVGFHVLGMIVYLPWILYTEPWKGLVQDDGVNPGWWGVFTAASMFNDLGYTLTPDSMISFQYATVILTLGSFLIIFGNTGFPVMLRFVIWCLSKIAARDSPVWQELRFLLDHPRRCFTLLFPSRANWILFGILLALNGIDLIFFIVLDLNDTVVTGMPPGYQVLNGLFQAASTRTAGFSSVNIAQLHPAIQVSYMIMMYISVLPIAMSVRRTNVYEEASLGFYSAKDDAEVDMNDKSFLGQHLRRQLSFDLWYVFFGFFIIAIVEGQRLAAMDDPAFSMFAVLFEIVSAYGTVGLSLGYPTINASFSAELHVLSKLIILAMMVRGRHRGLPYALDRAVLLPSEERFLKESEEAARRHGRRPSMSSGIPHRKTWAAGDAAENDTIEGIDPMTAGAGGNRFGSRLDRRSSNASGVSGMTTTRDTVRQRGKHLASILASGLSAGPTMSKHD